jgi:hypothetical protein
MCKSDLGKIKNFCCEKYAAKWMKNKPVRLAEMLACHPTEKGWNLSYLGLKNTTVRASSNPIRKRAKDTHRHLTRRIHRC